MTLRELLIGQFGVTGVDVRETTYSVGSTTAVVILPNDPNRIGFLVSNLSSNTINISFVKNTSSSNGLVVGGNGTLSSNWRDDMSVVGYERSALSQSGTNNIYVVEFVMYANEIPSTSA